MAGRHTFLRRLGLIALGGVLVAVVFERRRRSRSAPTAVASGRGLVRMRQPVASDAVTDASDDPIEPEAAADDSFIGATARPGTVYAASEARVDAEVEADLEGDEPVAVDAAPEPEPAAPAIDLEAIERDLEGVAMALARLDDGTYWTDEVTGDPLADQLLVADPVARRNR